VNHAIDVISDIQFVALGVIVGLAVMGRVAVFCYWWVAGAWQDEKCKHGGGHHFTPVIPNENPGKIPGSEPSSPNCATNEEMPRARS
jgi:hypothetical protein